MEGKYKPTKNSTVMINNIKIVHKLVSTNIKYNKEK